jgi:hypothetical protein
MAWHAVAWHTGLLYTKVWEVIMNYGLDTPLSIILNLVQIFSAAAEDGLWVFNMGEDET